VLWIAVFILVLWIAVFILVLWIAVFILVLWIAVFILTHKFAPQVLVASLRSVYGAQVFSGYHAHAHAHARASFISTNHKAAA
jgi:hypothetical protein